MHDLDPRGIDAVAFTLAQEMWTWSMDQWDNPTGDAVFKKAEYVSRATRLIEHYMKVSDDNH
jgi:hypothetical protein